MGMTDGEWHEGAGVAALRESNARTDDSCALGRESRAVQSADLMVRRDHRRLEFGTQRHGTWTSERRGPCSARPAVSSVCAPRSASSIVEQQLLSALANLCRAAPPTRQHYCPLDIVLHGARRVAAVAPSKGHMS